MTRPLHLCGIGDGDVIQADTDAAAETGRHRKINVTVTSIWDGERINYWIKRGAPARKIIDAFARQKGLDTDKIRFSFDG